MNKIKNYHKLIIMDTINYPNLMNNLDKSVLIIISRYNENLEWLKENSFNKYNAIIYNKGINDNYYNSPKIINKIN